MMDLPPTRKDFEQSKIECKICCGSLLCDEHREMQKRIVRKSDQLKVFKEKMEAGEIELECEECHNKFTVYGAKAHNHVRDSHKFCSSACRGKWYRKQKQDIDLNFVVSVAPKGQVSLIFNSRKRIKIPVDSKLNLADLIGKLMRCEI